MMMKESEPMPGRKLIRALDKAARGVIVAFTGLSLFLICLQVFFRFVMNNALAWPEEAVVYLMIWFSLLAAVYVQRERGHIRLVFFYNKVSDKTKLVFDILSNAAVIVFMAVVCYEGVAESIALMDMETSALRLPRAVPFLAIPLTGALILVVNLVLIVEDYKGLTKK